MNSADKMNPPIGDNNDTLDLEEVVAIVQTQNCDVECHGDEESTVPAEDNLQALAADAIIMEEGLFKFTTVRIRLVGEVVVLTKDLEEVVAIVQTQNCAEECAGAEESILSQQEMICRPLLQMQ